MLNARFLLFGALVLMLSYEVDAMQCNFGGLTISCPTAFDDGDKVFCCETNADVKIQVCCNMEDWARQNGAIMAGIVIGALVLIVICTVCCCCFCSCCLLARRRQRGTVLYGPLNGAQVVVSPAPSSYPVVHPFPPSQFSSPPPPPYQPTTVPNDYNQQQQPPKNTYYHPQ